MPNEPVVYSNAAGAQRTVRTNEDRVKAEFDGFKPPKSPPAKKAPANS